MFYPFMRENFLKNYDKLMEFVEAYQIDEPGFQTVHIYKMSTYIDYRELKEKLVAAKQLVDTT
jgi:hypothetical protein